MLLSYRNLMVVVHFEQIALY